MKRSVLKHMTVVALLLLLGWAVLAEECMVTIMPGESIQAAIDAASPGDVICLAEGEWEENLVIEKSLTLRAAGIESEPQAVIRSAREDWPVILIRSQEPIEVTVQGLKITGAFGAAFTGVDIYADGISVHGKATATIDNNTIRGNGRFGILMLSSSQATITSNTLGDNGRDGIRMWHSSQAAIEGNTISGNGSSGIVMLSSSQVTIANNTIFGNREGIGLGRASHATIASNTIRDNEREGIRMWGSFHATLTGNMIRDNDGFGVALWESPCVNTDSVFTGYITGQGNTGGGNAKDDYCPEDLVFLFTEEGGGLDRRE